MNPIGSLRNVHPYMKIETRYDFSRLCIIPVSSRMESEQENGSDKRSER
jgi:hypothetical protein